MKLLLIATFSVFIICHSFIYALAEDPDAKRPEEENKEFKRYSLEYELDPYYSNVGLYINLTDRPVPDAGDKSELDVYKGLFLSSYVPRFIVLEASVFPMPDLGVLIKENASDFYKEAQLSDDLNLVKVVTAGFEEPYALNIFLGNVVKFTRPGEDKQQGNFGYMGYLFSFGDYHIKDNDLVKEDWLEMEWKVKGDRKFSSHKLHWSYRVGVKLHEHPDIADVAYISMRRSRLDFEASAASIIKNSGFEYTFDMDLHTLEPVSHYFMVDKKLPSKDGRYAVSIALGFIWEGSRKYRGSLSDEESDRRFKIIIRPNIQF